MREFDVLDRNTTLSQNYFLEASAGTGKTFTIENIVLRLLLEKDLTLDKILIVTFTKAATRDLKVRIRQNIEKALQWIKNNSCDMPDYLKVVCNFDNKGVARKLEQALFGFSQASIFTIHSFCAKMLGDFVFEGDLFLDAVKGDEMLENGEVFQVIRDFFRTELDAYGKLELKQIKPNQVENKLFSCLMKGFDVRSVPSYEEKFDCVKREINKLKQEFRINIIESFLEFAPNFNGIARKIKDEEMEKLKKYAGIFEKIEIDRSDFEFVLEDQFSSFYLLDPSNRTKNGREQDIRPPKFFSECVKRMQPILSVNTTIAKMCYDAKNLLKRRMREEERLTFDDLLKCMQYALNHPLFLEKVQNTFKAAVIDEFQDTDPVQWDIFYKLFISGNHWKGNLFLVGDPKQSIYGFRGADVYSYLKACSSFEKNSLATLNTNHRSSKELIAALNAIFDVENLFFLPETQTCIKYAPVHFSSRIPSKTFSDDLGAVHFFSVICQSFKLEELEEQFYFPFITQEVQRLVQKDKFAYKDIAILVKDRYQADRVSDTLRRFGVPFAKQRTESLAGSDALPAVRELLKAVLFCHHDSTLKTALCGPIIGFNHEMIKKLENQEFYEHVLYHFVELRQTFFLDGFTGMACRFFNTSFFDDGKNVLEKLLEKNDGLQFYTEIMQLFELLMEEHAKTKSSLDKLIAFLDRMKALNPDEDERLKKRQDPNQDAVQILTMHSSKGLEYEIVFALGVVKRSVAPDTLIPVRFHNEKVLVPVTDQESEEYLTHCKELDAEKMRLFYVALTRAKQRVYCPFFEEASEKPPKPGTQSPMDLYRKFKPEIRHANITFSTLNEAVFDLVKTENIETLSLCPPKSFTPEIKKKYITSFSMLAKRSEAHDAPAGAPRDFESEDKTPHTLPAGAETGILLHKILEQIPLEKVRAAKKAQELLPFVLPCIAGTRFESWEKVINKIVFNALRTPLVDDFCVSDIRPYTSYKELEFLYPTKDGLMKGIIDLTFEYKNKIYILDWKSNWLGTSYLAYQSDRLPKVMEENRYLLQSEIYAGAVKRYLNVFEGKSFGGVFYVFLRGVALETGLKSGVYFEK